MVRFSRAVLRAGLVAALATTASAASAETFKLAIPLPPGHSIIRFGFAPWVECVKEQSKGAIEVNMFPGNQIADTLGTLDAVNNGLAELSMLVPSVLSDKMPLSGISMMPGMGDTAVEMAAAFRKVFDAGGPLADEFTKNKIKMLWVQLLPAYQLVSKSGPLETLDQIKGRKLRVAGGLMGLTVRSVGAVPVDIPAADAYMAVQQGTVDGVVFALSSVQSYKLQEVVKGISSNGSFGSSPTILVIDSGIWAKLSPDKQKVLTDCSAKTERDVNKSLDDENEALKKAFVAAGVNVYSFSPQVKAALDKDLEKVATEYVTRMDARGVKAKEVYESYRKALGK